MGLRINVIALNKHTEGFKSLVQHICFAVVI